MLGLPEINFFACDVGALLLYLDIGLMPDKYIFFSFGSQGIQFLGFSG
jgi:hypothetical protein